jgi:hypothetical protein
MQKQPDRPTLLLRSTDNKKKKKEEKKKGKGKTNSNKRVNGKYMVKSERRR